MLPSWDSPQPCPSKGSERSAQEKLLTLEGTIISVRKRDGFEPPDLTGRSVKLKVVKKGSKDDAVQALPCVPDHVGQPGFQETPAELAPASPANRPPATQGAQHQHEAPLLSQEQEPKSVKPEIDLEHGLANEMVDHLMQSATTAGQDGDGSESNSSPRDTNWADPMMQVLDKLNRIQKFRKAALRASRRYSADMWLACRLAFWVLVVGSPLIVYPVSEFLNNWGSRSSKYMASYSMAMMNFCFLLGPSLGASVRCTMEGVFGTLLALGNVLLLNQAFGSYMKGGAFVSREAMSDVALDKVIYRSSWLPLCNLGNGDRFVMTNSTAEFLQECFINIHWSSLTDAAVRSIIILADLSIFISGILWIGFGSSARVYAMTYLLYWAMLFVNPTSESFTTDPSDPWTQAIMTCAGGSVAVLSQLLPCCNDALGKAAGLVDELAETVAAVIEALPYATKPEVNLAVESAIEGSKLWESDIAEHLASAWFEDFGIYASRARRRQKLEAYAELLSSLLQHAAVAARLAKPLSPAEVQRMELALNSLQELCGGASRAIPASGSCADARAVEEYDEAADDLRDQFPKAVAKNLLTGPTLSFVLALTTIASGTISRLKVLDAGIARRCGLIKFLTELCVRLELPQTRKYPAHPRFVFRSTLAMVLAFIFGWVGLERVLGAYSYGASFTVAVVVANTSGAGFSLGLITRRLNSAIIGTVLGQAVGQVLAVKTEFHAALFALFLWGFSFTLIFQILHSAANRGVALPIFAIGVGSLVPSGGIFREYNATIEVSAEIDLAASIKATVLGGTIMLVIDLFLFSSARSLSQLQLKQAVRKCIGLLSRVMGLNTQAQAREENVDGSSNEETLVLKHLDELRRLLPAAATEPAPRGVEFPSELFGLMEDCLRTLVTELDSLEWFFDMIPASASASLSNQPDFAVLLQEAEDHFSEELKSIQVLLKDLYGRRLQAAPLDETGGGASSDAAAIRQSILDKGSHEMRASASPKNKKQKGTAATRRLSFLASATGSRQYAFQGLVQKMRAAASSQRGDSPMSDMLSQVELLLSALHICSAAMTKVQIALAQYG